MVQFFCCGGRSVVFYMGFNSVDVWAIKKIPRQMNVEVRLMQKNKLILNKFLNKKVKCNLDDGFIKVGFLESYDAVSYYLRYYSGDLVAINRNIVRQMVIIPNVDRPKNNGGVLHG